MMLTILFAVAVFGCNNCLQLARCSVSHGAKWPYLLTGVCQHPSLDFDGCYTVYKGAQSNQAQPPPSEHDWTLDWAWTQPLRLRDASWKTEETIQRWFTAFPNRTMTSGTKQHGRQKQERHAAWENLVFFLTFWVYFIYLLDLLANSLPHI